MRTKLQTLTIILILVLPLLLNAQFREWDHYLSNQEYRNLNQGSQARYNVELQGEFDSFLERKAQAIRDGERLSNEIVSLRSRLGTLNTELAEIYERMGISESDFTDLHTKIQYYKDQLTNWERMSDNELWRNVKAVKELEEDYRLTKAHRLAQLPEFQADFSDLDRRFRAINEAIDRAGRSSGYYEDNYTVVQGDTYPRISGYDYIYNDSSKWGIIFRANRDLNRTANDLRAGQVIKIPRGLPTSWKVYSGEYLWKISQYPEVYGTGYKWPIIYRANRDQIKDPDLIYPNQVFTIPRDN